MTLAFREQRVRLEMAREQVAGLEAELFEVEMAHRRQALEAQRASRPRYVDPRVRADFDRFGRPNPPRE